MFKKHFAKAIGNEMLGERVKVVQVMLAKLCREVPQGYSKSIDKVRQQLSETASADVSQFMNDAIIDLTRYLKA